MNAICLEHIRKVFGERVVLDDICLTIPYGTRHGATGASGCGKSTLSGILLGTLTPDGGTVTGLPDKRAAVFQQDRLCETLNAVANVRLVTGRAVSRAAIETLLTDLGLGDSLAVPVSTLSGGMKRRVAIARALMADFDLLVLDEPFTGLDDDTREKTVAVIERYIAGKTLFLISHDVHDFERLHAEPLRLPGQRPLAPRP